MAMVRPILPIAALWLLAMGAATVCAGDPHAGIIPEGRIGDLPPQVKPNLTLTAPTEVRIAPDSPTTDIPPIYKRPADAFSETAQVTPLIDPQTKAKLEKDQGSQELPTLEEKASAAGQILFDARFDQPANFPLPKFGPDGQAFAEEGVLIHEGMRLTATADGRYEVSFVASTRAMPVTLRLQLQVVEPQTGRHFTLTLPPISILPDRGFTGNYPGQTWQVRQNGVSRMIGMMFPDLHCCMVARQGTARFGSWPEGINEFSRLPR
jgi:hypothetical protein